MKVLNFREFMKKYNLKKDAMKESQFLIILYTLEIVKYIQIKDL